MCRRTPKTSSLAAIAAVILVYVLIAVVPPAAEAGTIWVTDGNMNAGQTGGCNAFGLYGDLSALTSVSGCAMSFQVYTFMPQGQNAYWMTTAPPGITINSAWTTNGDVTSGGTTNGFIAGDFWKDNTTGQYGGSQLAPTRQYFNTALEGSPNINSQIYGFQIACAQDYFNGGCYPPPSTLTWLTVSGIELEGTENSGPYVTGQGSFWTSGSWVWNPPGDSWPLTLYSSDVSGICSSEAVVDGVQVNGPSEPRDNTVWQQCPNPVNWGFSVDTRTYVPASGTLSLELYASNAAAVSGGASADAKVDNDPVGVSFRTPNDPNPSVWVNHAVTVDATPTAGPSGVSGMNCAIDRGSARSYPASGLTVNGDGVHTVTCTAWNNAVDPQGQPNTGTGSMTIHIDEAPPSLGFEPPNPTDPTGLVVDTSDSESGVAGGSIEMAPAGTNAWSSLPTAFDGAHLLAHFDDAGLRGPYTFKATSCDNVGNCATTIQTLALPLRLASDSQVSLTKIVDPLRRRVVQERVRVGWHWVTVRRGGRLVRVKRGGRIETIKVVKYVEQCTIERVQVGAHRWRVERICKAPHVRVTTTLRVPYGHEVTLHGLYTTAAGVPLAGQPVHIIAAPDNNTGAFAPITTVTTGASGSWAATLPPGPSRIIRAVTDGSATILPSSGQVTTIVPADVKLLSVSPRHVAWGGTVHLVGQLLGGYLPPDGALVRLRIGYGSTYETYGVQEHVTGSGRFATVASFGPGDPSIVRTYWFQIASLPMGNYPYAPAASRRVNVIVGGHPRASICCRSG
jgi:hypothetical protein